MWRLPGRSDVAIAANPVFVALSSTLWLACVSAAHAGQPAPPSGFERQIIVTIDNTPQLDLRRAGSTLRGYFSPGAYRAGPTARQVAEEIGREYHLVRRDAWPIRVLKVHCIVYEVPGGASRDDVLASLARDPRVESVQPMQSFRSLGGPPHAEPQFRLRPDEGTLSVLGAHRWARGHGVRIGIIDTGVDVRHRDLNGRVVAIADFAGRGWDTFLADRHGTAVAGVIAASDNEGLGIVGVAPDASLIVAKACWYEGDRRQTAAVCSSFTLARALAFALEQRVDVLNISLGGPRDALLERLVAAAISANVIVVAAQPDGARAEAFPSGVDGVIPVLAVESETAAQRAD